MVWIQVPVPDDRVAGGLITMERVAVVLYRHHGADPGKP